MQRVINNPNMVVSDMINGFLKAHKDLVALTSNRREVKYKEAPIQTRLV